MLINVQASSTTNNMCLETKGPDFRILQVQPCRELNYNQLWYPNGFGFPLPPQPAVATIKDGSYLGCYINFPKPVVSTPKDFVDLPADCAAHAPSGSYFGITDGGQCWIGTAPPQLKLLAPDEDCNQACAGEPFSACGSNQRVTLYQKGAIPAELVNYRFFGCFANPDYPNISSASMTAAECRTLAENRKHEYISMTAGGRCSTGLNIPAVVAQAGDCGAQCKDGFVCGSSDSKFATIYERQTSIQIIPQFAHLGCVAKPNSFTLEQESLTTPVGCSSIATAREKIFVGVTARGQCWTGTDMPTTPAIDPEKCRNLCSTDNTLACGSVDGNYFHIYKAVPKPVVVPSLKYIGCFETPPTVSSAATSSTSVANCAKAVSGKFVMMTRSDWCYSGDISPQTLVGPEKCADTCSGDQSACGSFDEKYSTVYQRLPSIPPISEYKYAGCFKTPEFSPSFPIMDTSNTPVKCAENQAKPKKYKYFSMTQGGVCAISMLPPSTEVATRQDCDGACAADGTSCGDSTGKFASVFQRLPTNANVVNWRWLSCHRNPKNLTPILQNTNTQNCANEADKDVSARYFAMGGGSTCYLGFTPPNQDINWELWESCDAFGIDGFASGSADSSFITVYRRLPRIRQVLNWKSLGCVTNPQYTTASTSIKTLSECIKYAVTANQMYVALSPQKGCMIGNAKTWSSSFDDRCDSEQDGTQWGRRNDESVATVYMRLPSPAPAPTGFRYEGCFQIISSDYTYYPSSKTLDACATQSTKVNSNYLAMAMGSSCYTSNVLNSTLGVSDSFCDKYCTSSNFACGSETSKYGTIYTRVRLPQVASVPGFAYHGCARSPSFTSLETASNPTKCSITARAKSFKYFGLTTGGQCSVGDSAPSTMVLDSFCDTPCSSTQSVACGGGNGLYHTVYRPIPPIAPEIYRYISMGCFENEYIVPESDKPVQDPQLEMSFWLDRDYDIVGLTRGGKSWGTQLTTNMRKVEDALCNAPCIRSNNISCGSMDGRYSVVYQYNINYNSGFTIASLKLFDHMGCYKTPTRETLTPYTAEAVENTTACAKFADQHNQRVVLRTGYNECLATNMEPKDKVAWNKCYSRCPTSPDGTRWGDSCGSRDGLYSVVYRRNCTQPLIC
jgi:hypothetical protein